MSASRQGMCGSCDSGRHAGFSGEDAASQREVLELRVRGGVVDLPQTPPVYPPPPVARPASEDLALLRHPVRPPMALRATTERR